MSSATAAIRGHELREIMTYIARSKFETTGASYADWLTCHELIDGQGIMAGTPDGKLQIITLEHPDWLHFIRPSLEQLIERSRDPFTGLVGDERELLEFIADNASIIPDCNGRVNSLGLNVSQIMAAYDFASGKRTNVQEPGKKRQTWITPKHPDWRALTGLGKAMQHARALRLAGVSGNVAVRFVTAH